MKKRIYETMRMDVVTVEAEGTVLAASIVNHTTIESVPQAVGLEITDFSTKKNEIDGGSTFNQDWDGGSW